LGKSDENKKLRKDFIISMEERFKQERKRAQGGSIVWKALVKAFPLIGN
jgi:hypothetical protein